MNKIKFINENNINVNGFAILKNVEYKKTKTGKTFATGQISNGEDVRKFNCWNPTILDGIDLNKAVKIYGEMSFYNDQFDVTINNVEVIDRDISKLEFLPYDEEHLTTQYQELYDILENNLSEAGFLLIKRIMNETQVYPNLKKDLKYEFAAQKMHDAKVGGLISHTIKMLKYALVLIDTQEDLQYIKNANDLLLIGIFIHDLGKLKELKFGEYQKHSFASHRITGIEMLHEHKPYILTLYDEHFYYELTAIVSGHHGQYGDTPTTIISYFVHLIDMLDSQASQLIEKVKDRNIVEGPDNVVTTNIGGNFARLAFEYSDLYEEEK